MIVGIPREVQTDEHRVSLTPDKVDLLVREGHEVVIESDAGVGATFGDETYRQVGAKVVETAADVFNSAEMIVKVKEPQPEEYALFRENQIIFTFLHLAAEPELAQALLSSKVTGISYETVKEPDGNLPLLYPMSEIAGKLAPLVASNLLQNIYDGPGKLIGGVPGTAPCRFVVVGGGTVGYNAAQMALALGGHVTVLDISLERLRTISGISDGHINTRIATPGNVSELIGQADVVIGAVLVPGSRAPSVITANMLSNMPERGIVIDVAIDQGGSVEGIHPTTHRDPTYLSNGVTHYAVTNMPGILGNTSSISLSNATYPYVLRLANAGLDTTVQKDTPISEGVITLNGHLTHPVVAEALDLDHIPAQQAIGL